MGLWLHLAVPAGVLVRNDERMRNDCVSCCFFHSPFSALADCLLTPACSTAGRPQGILAGSPPVGETG